MDAPPILFEADSELGQSYIQAMNLAGNMHMPAGNWSLRKSLRFLINHKSHMKFIITIILPERGTFW